VENLKSLSDQGAQHSNTTASEGRELLANVESRKTNLAMLRLMEIANERPYYRYNGMWTRQMENASFENIFLNWLGIRVGDSGIHLEAEGELLSYERVAASLNGIQ
jgi:hypothetical protein